MLYGKLILIAHARNQQGLNPYFFGKCSTALCQFIIKTPALYVLILIFLENALRLYKTCFVSNDFSVVLILIFLENALRHLKATEVHEFSGAS